MLEKKLIDSLLGRDSLGNPVPDPSLPSKLRYGVEIRPRQGLFVNRNEALRNILEFVNNAISTERLTGQIDFTNLNSVDEYPSNTVYDTVVEDIFNLQLIVTRPLITAELTAVINNNGEVVNVLVNNAGFGYVTPPTITITGDGTGAEFNINLNLFGSVTSVDIIKAGKNYSTDFKLIARPYTVLVQTDADSAGKWALYEWNKTKSEWIKITTQSYSTPLFWKYIDWADASYNPLQNIISTVAEPYALEVLQQLPKGSYVKVQNGGDGRFLILCKTAGTGGTFDTYWDIVYSERGTIKFLDTIWNPSASLFAWDQEVGWDQTQYDQTPDKEVEYILSSLKNDIFIGDRKAY